MSEYSLRKITNAIQSFGRGMDNYRQSAKYEVLKGEAVVGTLFPEPVRYGQTAVWVLYNSNDREVERFYKGGRKAAERWLATHNFDSSIDL